MKDYRIVKRHGDSFVIQAKGWFGWHDLYEWIGPECQGLIVFDTIEEARDDMVKREYRLARLSIPDEVVE